MVIWFLSVIEVYLLRFQLRRSGASFDSTALMMARAAWDGTASLIDVAGFCLRATLTGGLLIIGKPRL